MSCERTCGTCKGKYKFIKRNLSFLNVVIFPPYHKIKETTGKN